MFEVLAEDLLGRIGRIRLKDGRRVETPLFLPVINPVTQEISAGWMGDNLRAEAVITNAYIIYRRLREKALEEGVHGLLRFDGVVMTDSGGYQILEYGDVEVTPEEIALFQEKIGSDIAVPLDVPTGICPRERAEKTVEETLRNLKKTMEIIGGNKVRRALWVAPIQGGVHLDLLQRCAKLEKGMDFDLYALGSPTPLMEGYKFGKLFEMIFAVRKVIGFGKPLHLFGAGHPMIFPFIVALGVDMFDSASYFLYARDNRYITPTGTLRIDKLDYFPCSCPICLKLAPDEVRELERGEMVKFLAMHNLYVFFKEINEIKQAIRDGRLMELLEVRARSHPMLYQAFKEILEHDQLLDMMEKHTPISSRRGINLFDRMSLNRPRIRRARKKLLENYFTAGSHGDHIVLLPINRKIGLKKLEEIVREPVSDTAFYGTPYGLVPYSLKYVYPFSQTNYPKSLLKEGLDDLLNLMLRQLKAGGYKRVTILESKSRHLREFAENLLIKLSEQGIEGKFLNEKGKPSRPRLKGKAG